MRQSNPSFPVTQTLYFIIMSQDNTAKTTTVEIDPQLTAQLAEVIELPAADAGFEVQIATLEQIVKLLEAGDISLDTSLALFEAGVQIQRRCQTQLSTAEDRVAVLMKKNGELHQSYLDEET